MPLRGRQIRLAARPHGEPEPSDFSLVEVDVPEPGSGQVVVRNQVMSVDPYMRGRMDAGPSYVPAYRLGEPLEGGAVGTVVESRSPDLAPGDVVLHGFGWRDYAVGAVGQFRAVDVGQSPASAYLGVLGMPGFTAYVGLLDIAGMREGDVVFVSAAAGMVGSVAGQVARLRGAARVVGSAGSEEKVRFIRDELGFDAAFDYHGGRVTDLLREAAPDGIDLYFDNVGGDHLEAALGAMHDHGRAALCGAISMYNATEAPPGPRNLALALTRRLTLRGFLIIDHADRQPDFLREMSRWLRDGRVRYRETWVDGLERAPEALLGLFHGSNIGKMLVRVSD